MKLLSTGLLVAFLTVMPVTQVRADARPPLTVQILDASGKIKSFFDIDTSNLAGGAKVAVGDLGSDGVSEIVLGMGLGNEPRVNVYRLDGSLIGSFLAYQATMGLGINVTVCDVDGDGVNDIVTGTQYGAGPHVRTFDNVGEAKDNGGFMAYAASFRGGVNISCGDLTGDGRAELVTSPGPTGGPDVKIWSFSHNTWQLIHEVFAFAPEETGGTLTTVNNGALYVTLQKTSGNHVIKSYVIHSFLQEESVQENHTVTTASIFTLDDQLVTTSTEGGYIANNIVDLAIDVPFGSLHAVGDDVDNDGQEEIIVVPDRPLFASSTAEKSIIIDLSDQRLYAYKNGVLANTFLISSAKEPFETPTGETAILAKLPYVDYTWSYGPGNPNNYSLGLVPWNLRIFPHIYIHYAYWHNNFGYPMSHGCVNVNLENIKWIYNWADVGTAVLVQT